MIEEKFKVIQLVREFIVVVDKELDNFPRKDIEIKSRLRNSCFDLLEMLYGANMVGNTERKKEILEMSIAKVKLIDYLINLSYDRELISNKKFLKLGTNLEEIVRYISGWLKKYVNPQDKD